ncbi:MAG: alpha/beta fold hydrolase [Acetobacteraceae bacterium]|nr:MAG: alpha/beta fold hydrolase [Acetobacteraceae bacterium]
MTLDKMLTSLGPPQATGTPWVLLHGFAGHPLDWQPALVDGRAPAFALTLPGHGAAPEAPCADYLQTIDALAARLQAALPTPLHLCGYSLGARLALGLAIRHPQLCARVTLIGVHPGLQNAADRAARAQADGRWQRLLHDEGIRAFLDAWEAQPLFATQLETGRVMPAQRAAYRARRLLHQPQMLALAHASTSLAIMPSLWGELGRVACPVHLITGREDAKFCQIARAMCAHLPEVVHTLLPHCGHNPLLEAFGPLGAALAL